MTDSAASKLTFVPKKTLKRQTGSYELETKPGTHNQQRIATKNVERIQTNEGKTTHKKVKL